jgi:outer membrane murein-binding lipoprotein Lpp
MKKVTMRVIFLAIVGTAFISGCDNQNQIDKKRNRLIAAENMQLRKENEKLRRSTETEGFLQVQTDHLAGPYGSMPVISYAYDAASQKGTLSVDISGKGIEAREWIIKNIGRICSSKNIIMEAGKETKACGYYRVMNESVQDGILTIEFEAVR